jgi:threonine dehydratase
VVCASAGNLGQALAYGGRLRNIGVTVTASSAASPLKIEKMRALGANVILVEGEIEAALQEALNYAGDTGAFLVEDSRNLDTCEGAASIGFELANLPHALDMVLVSLGAGAMATVVGFALKCQRSEVKIICVQPHNAPAMTLSYRAGRVVEWELPTLSPTEWPAVMLFLRFSMTCSLSRTMRCWLAKRASKKACASCLSMPG